MADIESMYFQVFVTEHQRSFQRIFWWDKNDKEMTKPVEYEMNVHIFGATSSASCSNYALKKTAFDNQGKFGIDAAETLLKNFYVDDMLKSKDNLGETISLMKNVTSMCKAGGFRLTKFVSNNKEVLLSIPEDDRKTGFTDCELLSGDTDLPSDSTLGITWDIEMDCFKFKIDLKKTPYSRRGMLSLLSTLYDPLGFLAPFLVIGKIILQELCSMNLNWDDPVPEDNCNAWNIWKDCIQPLEGFRIPRCFKPEKFGKIVHSSIHYFSDASEFAYGQATYLRIVNESDRVHVCLVMGKARVAPLKFVSMPRLELTAATLSVKIASLLRQELRLLCVNEYFWTDSEVVLGYLKNQTKRFKVFVANRIEVIRSNSKIIDVERLKCAERKIMRLTQEKYFETELRNLLSGKINVKNKLSKLNPFVDSQGLLRVGGRIERSGLDKEHVHPIIMPKDSQTSIVIIRYCYQNVAHAGRGITINKVRSYGIWIVNINSLTRKVIHKCTICRSLRGRAGEQKMADLPQERFNEAPPFSYCGLDCFGPFLIKVRRSEMKRYGVLFTCLSSRAVHIETSSSLETDTFILAPRRFVGRRGNVRYLRSDNGSNFVGSNNELKRAFLEMDHEKIKFFLNELNADWIWNFNPPAASHMGGVWERQIRSARQILTSLLKTHGSSLDDESLNTLLIETEAILNSRPLTVNTLSDANSFLPISPSNILTMKSDVVLPPPGEFPKPDVYSRKRWRRVQHIANEFWIRWRKEFLSTLQERRRWNTIKRNFEVGDIVILKDSTLFTVRNRWPLARIVSVVSDKHGIVRIVNIRMSGSRVVMQRPISKVVLLLENE